MDEKIINKRMFDKDIIYIAELLQLESTKYKDKQRQEDERIKNLEASTPDDTFVYFDKHSFSGEVVFRIDYKNGQSQTRTNDLDWFKEAVNKEKADLVGIKLSFNTWEIGKDTDISQSIYLTLDERSIDISSTAKNSNNDLAMEIRTYINNLPEKYDNTIRYDGRRQFIPALSVGIQFSIIMTIILFVLNKINVLNIDFFNNGLFYIGLMCILSVFWGVILPTKNKSLYKKIKFKETYFSGKNGKIGGWNKDYEDFKNSNEVEIGKNVNMPIIRKEIEDNYKRGKQNCLIMFILMIIVGAIFILV